jgi:DNA-binding response OmpR family regulator
MGAECRRRVLLAASNLIVGISVADELELAGHEVVGPFRSCGAALKALAQSPPDIAVLDAVLNDAPSDFVTGELARAGVPVVILTAWSRQSHTSVGYESTTWLPLPCPAGAVVEVVEALLPGASPGL